MNIGSVILYVDESGVEHQALVTQVWEEDALGGEVVNVAYVSADINRVDCNGRQLEYRRTVLHQDDLDVKISVKPDAPKVSSIIAASSGAWRVCAVQEVEPVKAELVAASVKVEL